jgi:hypothetical protein
MAGGQELLYLSMPTANYSGTTTGSPTVATDGQYNFNIYSIRNLHRIMAHFAKLGLNGK